MTKKQVLTKLDIQRELLIKLNKAKYLSVFLTIMTAVSILSYLLLVVDHDSIIASEKWGNGRLILNPTAALFVMPLVILFLVIFLLDFYYIDLYKAKKGEFIIIEEKLYERKRELIRYYRRTEKENSLYFPSGRVAVDDKVYSYSDVGDSFYTVVLRSKKPPLLVYHTKYCEINL